MARKKETDKLDVKLGMNNVSDAARRAIYSLENIHSCYGGGGLSIKEILKLVNIIKDECGEDAIFEITSSYSEYFGHESNCDLRWTREETDDEVEKRIETNEKRRKTASATRKAAKIEKAEKERAELKRLAAKYPDLVKED